MRGPDAQTARTRPARIHLRNVEGSGKPATLCELHCIHVRLGHRAQCTRRSRTTTKLVLNSIHSEHRDALITFLRTKQLSDCMRVSLHSCALTVADDFARVMDAVHAGMPRLRSLMLCSCLLNPQQV